MTEKLIELDATICRMGKYSNNTEMHGEEFARGWKVPFESVMLDAEHLQALFGDPHVDRAWFNEKKGGLKEPMPWIRKDVQRYPDKFDKAAVGIEISGDRMLEFEDCIVQIDELVPQTGGLTKTKISIYLHPDDKQMLQLDLHQHREVKLSISDAKVALKKKSKQQELPLNGSDAKTPGYDEKHAIENGDGEETELRSAAEIDAEMNARNPDGPKMGEAANGSPPDDGAALDGIGPKTRAEIEKVKARRGGKTAGGRKAAH